MSKTVDFIFLVPARKGSKRVKNKNFKRLINLSLVEHTFKFIRENFNSKIYFSTDYVLDDLTKKKYNIEIVPVKTDSDSVEQITQNYTSILESYIKKYPEQYFWFHKRWKTKVQP